MVKDLKTWWKELPWYWKIPTSVVLIAVAVIAFLQAFKKPEDPPKPADDAHTNIITGVLENLGANIEDEKKGVEEAKVAINKGLDEAGESLAESATIKAKVAEAKSIADLIAIKEEHKL